MPAIIAVMTYPEYKTVPTHEQIEFVTSFLKEIYSRMTPIGRLTLERLVPNSLIRGDQKKYTLPPTLTPMSDLDIMVIECITRALTPAPEGNATTRGGGVMQPVAYSNTEPE